MCFKKIFQKNSNINYRTKENLTNVEKNVIEDLDHKKPWGFYDTLVRNKTCTPKVLGINDELSLQSHKNRDEIWFLAKGKLVVYRTKVIEPIEKTNSKIKTIAKLKKNILKPGDGIFIPKNTAHGARNLSRKGSLVVEVALGKAEEKDITRLYDKSGRTKVEGIPEGLSAPKVIRFCKKYINKNKK
jgi:mannose-6-phosphate isomerase-like protein (cupin superfamily)|tara:strand:+ start:1590 stop:2147 length:558 start_codon:yes stop_codon:yes gene_type:complete